MESLVDPSYELIDPTPSVHSLFCQFDERFFDGRLAACEVKWSPRMTTCAGICCYEGRSGLCSIRLSTPLLKLRPRKDLVETLLHEMIHAFLFVTVRDRDRDGHGPQFQWHMNRINKEAGTRITIFHSFHAEVAVYKQHHWRCDGACRTRSPYYGWVRRSMNRAPSKKDLWWTDHERSCGGKFHKVAEPKEYTEKQEKADRRKAESGGAEKKKREAKEIAGGSSEKRHPAADAKQRRIDTVFGVHGGSKVGGVGGHILGGDSGRSRLLGLFDGFTSQKENRSTAAVWVMEQPRERKILKDAFANGSQLVSSMDAADDRDDDVVLYDPSGDAKDTNVQEDPDRPLIPPSSNEKRLFRMHVLEEKLRVLNVQVETLFNEGNDAKAVAAIEHIEQINSDLAVLRDTNMAWDMQEHDKFEEGKDISLISKQTSSFTPFLPTYANTDLGQKQEVSIVRRLTQTMELNIEQLPFTRDADQYERTCV